MTAADRERRIFAYTCEDCHSWCGDEDGFATLCPVCDRGRTYHRDDDFDEEEEDS